MAIINPKYGKIFRKLREQRGLSLSYFTEIGISKSTLATFERGESIMAFDKVLSSLYEMDVSLSEFEQLLNNYTIGYQQEKVIEIEKADLFQNVSVLKEIENELMKKGYVLLALATRSRYQKLSADEVGEIVNYLFESSNWGDFELSLIYFTVEQFRSKDLDNLLGIYWEKHQILLENPQYRNRFIQISYRVIALLCSIGDKKKAEYILNSTNKYVLEHTLFLNNLRYFTIGLYLYSFIDKSSGRKQMKTALNIFKTLGSASIAEYYERKYRNKINN